MLISCDVQRLVSNKLIFISVTTFCIKVDFTLGLKNKFFFWLLLFLESDIEVEKCDLFAGKWIPDSVGPIYTNNSCGSLIDGHQNCITNGRPDLDFLYWKWKPHDCLLPRFDPRRFLQLMRNKSWALIGDSISRNHVESLLCMLSTV